MRNLIWIGLWLLPSFSSAPCLAMDGHEAVNDESNVSKVEIKKFRFRKSHKKNFERLVIEFSSKSKWAGAPIIKAAPSATGRESEVLLEKINLIGAIPEALINDSYVPKSKFLGPVSINTDSPQDGFHIRAFLKQPVRLDAFWLENPKRLVVDAFPANSPRMEGRLSWEDMDDSRPSRSYASENAVQKKDDNSIVCYPIASAVSATVTFSPAALGSSNQPILDPALLMNGAVPGKGPEPVICFLANAQVTPNVAYKSRGYDMSQFYQWQPGGNGNGNGNFQNGQNNGFGGSSLFGGGGAFGGFQNKPGGPNIVVTDVPPGRTPLGTPLTNPNQVQRLPSSLSPAKLPGSGDLGAGAPATPPGLPNISAPTK